MQTLAIILRTLSARREGAPVNGDCHAPQAKEAEIGARRLPIVQAA